MVKVEEGEHGFDRVVYMEEKWVWEGVEFVGGSGWCR
jgi:hypothetical protein